LSVARAMRSARALRIARATLNDKIRKYGLSAA